MDISAQDLMGVAKPYFVTDGYDFVAYPNRNAVPFRGFYNIPEAETVIRGSLRYAGNPAFIKALIDLGWLDTEKKDWLVPGMTWAQIMAKAIGAKDSSERCVASQFRQWARSLTLETQIALSSRVSKSSASSRAKLKASALYPASAGLASSPLVMPLYERQTYWIPCLVSWRGK